MTSTTIDLRALHDAYTVKLNHLVGAGREDLLAELSDTYADEALRLMAMESVEHPD